MTTASRDCVNIWTLKGTDAKRSVCIPLYDVTSGKALAAIDAGGNTCVVHVTGGFTFSVYSVQPDFGSYNLKIKLDLSEELSRAKPLEQRLGEDDIISAIRFLTDDKTLRITQSRGGSLYQIDYNIVTRASPEIKKLDHHAYEDRSLFKYGLTYVDHHEALTKFIQGQTARGNLLAFPEQDFQSLIVLNREDPHNKHFLIYDTFALGHPLRRLQKLESLLLRPG